MDKSSFVAPVLGFEEEPAENRKTFDEDEDVFEGLIIRPPEIAVALRLFGPSLIGIRIDDVAPTDIDFVIVALKNRNGVKAGIVDVGCSCIPTSSNKAVAVVRLDAKLGKTDAEEGKMTLR